MRLRYAALPVIVRSCLVGGLLTACFAPAVAQQRPDRLAFSTVELQAGAATNVNRNGFHRYWSPQPGVEGQAHTPFYLGTVEAGLAYHAYTNAVDDVPSFKALQGHIGWGLPVRFGRRATLYTGARLGNYYMIFGDAVTTGTAGCGRDNPKGCGDDPSAVGGRTESELFMGLHHRLAVRVGGAWSVTLGGAYTHVFTGTRLQLWHVTAGLAATLRTPDWLRTFLR